MRCVLIQFLHGVLRRGPCGEKEGGKELKGRLCVGDSVVKDGMDLQVSIDFAEYYEVSRTLRAWDAPSVVGKPPWSGRRGLQLSIFSTSTWPGLLHAGRPAESTTCGPPSPLFSSYCNHTLSIRCTIMALAAPPPLQIAAHPYSPGFS